MNLITKLLNYGRAYDELRKDGVIATIDKDIQMDIERFVTNFDINAILVVRDLDYDSPYPYTVVCKSILEDFDIKVYSLLTEDERKYYYDNYDPISEAEFISEYKKGGC